MDTLLLITDSSFYPIFFRHHLTDYQIVVVHPDACMDGVKPNFIVIDDQRVKHSILDLCSHLRNAFHNVPILVITAQLKKSYATELTNVGVNGFIREPLEKGDLFEQLEKAKHYRVLEEKMDVLADTISEHSTSLDLRQKIVLNKNLLDPIYETLKRQKPLSLIALAVDDSDTHEFTDKHITETIKRIIEKKDPLFSLGHGKYLLILDHTPLREAIFIAETLKDVITHTMHIAVSMGIASQKKPPYANIHDMIGDAKKALLEAQKRGTIIEIFS